MPEAYRERNSQAGRFLMRYGIEGSFGAFCQKIK